MRLHRFYIQQPLAVNSTLKLSDDVWRHCVQVLRYKENDELLLFNGDGCDYLARLQKVEKKSAIAQVCKQIPVNNESPLKLHLYQGIARGDKMDWIIQKAVELGVSEITPIFTEFCNVRLDSQRLAKKQRHWQQIARSACEQSGRARIPQINEAIDIKQIENDDSTLLLLSPNSEQSIRQLQLTESVALIIGPEGGLSQDEEQLLFDRGAQSVQIGPRILRTETAGLAILSALQAMYGDW